MRPRARAAAKPGIAWATGEIPALIVASVIAAEWVLSNSRLARSYDRQVARDGDAELRQYNRHLAQLAATHADKYKDVGVEPTDASGRDAQCPLPSGNRRVSMTETTACF